MPAYAMITAINRTTSISFYEQIENVLGQLSWVSYPGLEAQPWVMNPAMFEIR